VNIRYKNKNKPCPYGLEKENILLFKETTTMATITYNQYNPEEVVFGDILNNFIEKEFNNEFQDIVVHFDCDPAIIANNIGELYGKLKDYSIGNWKPDAITSIEVRRPEFSNSISVEAKHW
jgi:hypothetical protein